MSPAAPSWRSFNALITSSVKRCQPHLAWELAWRISYESGEPFLGASGRACWSILLDNLKGLIKNTIQMTKSGALESSSSIIVGKCNLSWELRIHKPMTLYNIYVYIYILGRYWEAIHFYCAAKRRVRGLLVTLADREGGIQQQHTLLGPAEQKASAAS